MDPAYNLIGMCNRNLKLAHLIYHLPDCCEWRLLLHQPVLLPPADFTVSCYSAGTSALWMDYYRPLVCANDYRSLRPDDACPTLLGRPSLYSCSSPWCDVIGRTCQTPGSRDSKSCLRVDSFWSLCDKGRKEFWPVEEGRASGSVLKLTSYLPC